MGDLVNLHKARKATERALKGQSTAANRLKYGRSKAERKLMAARAAKARHDLDQHQIKTGDER